LPEDIKGNINDLVGLEEVKDNILQLKDIYKNKVLYEKNNVGDTFNIMFSGQAGTGKTKIALYLAKELNIPIITASGSDMVSKYQGSGVSFIKGFFKEAKSVMNKYNTDVIMFLDEADDILKDRKSFVGTNIEERTGPIIKILTELDGVKTKTNNKHQIIFIISSNFNEENMEIDPAIKRRFSKNLKFNLPNLKEREKLLNILLNKVDKNLI